MFEVPHGFPCPKDRINPPKKPGVKIESWGCFGPIPTSYPSTQRATSKSTPKCNGGIVPEQPNNSVHALSGLRKCAPCSQASKRKKMPNRVSGPRSVRARPSSSTNVGPRYPVRAPASTREKELPKSLWAARHLPPPPPAAKAQSGPQRATPKSADLGRTKSRTAESASKEPAPDDGRSDDAGPGERDAEPTDTRRHSSRHCEGRGDNKQLALSNGR